MQTSHGKIGWLIIYLDAAGRVEFVDNPDLLEMYGGEKEPLHRVEIVEIEYFERV